MWRLCKLTGKTSGMPPLTALVPSSTAPSLSQSFSLPLASFQLRTVAPCSRISTVSPVGSAALTRPLSMVTVGWAWDCCGVAARADGLLGRSTIVAVVWVCVGVWLFLFTSGTSSGAVAAAVGVVLISCLRSLFRLRRCYCCCCVVVVWVQCAAGQRADGSCGLRWAVGCRLKDRTERWRQFGGLLWGSSPVGRFPIVFCLCVKEA